MRRCPAAEAYAKLNHYLRTGGMILFDTRDADIADFGSASPTGRQLQQIAARLDIPPLEPIPEDHVLTRSFYLLQDFPGRYDSRDVWVEAAPPDAELGRGHAVPQPQRRRDAGGDRRQRLGLRPGRWMRAAIPCSRSVAGRPASGSARYAYRFGVNLIMHVLTGNYKSDQVHVPALLERLGQ